MAMGNYAMFLHKVRRNKVEALRMFLAATEAYPEHSAILVKFASFKKYCGELDAAEKLFMRAVSLAKEGDGEALGAYAVFLHAVRQDPARAGDMYDRAAKADPSHANNLSNYGLFLSDVMGNAAEAEAMYKAALEAEPDHANAAYNYAVLLDSALRDVPRAEAMYRRVLGGDPKHAYALYNLAVLLEELEHRDQLGPDRDPGEVLSLYERAVKAAPKDALSAADLGRYLLTKVKDLDGAEAMLARSLQLDPNNSVALYNMGLLLVDKKQDAGAATKLWKKLVSEVDPAHVNCLRRLARLAATAKDWKGADNYYRAALQAMAGGKQQQQGGRATTPEELEGLVNEVIATMIEAPGKSKSKEMADKLRRG